MENITATNTIVCPYCGMGETRNNLWDSYISKEPIVKEFCKKCRKYFFVEKESIITYHTYKIED